MFELGGGNLLIVSRSNLSHSGCEARGKKQEDEETLSIYDPDGTLLHRRSLGGGWVEPWLYTSETGDLVSLSTADYHHDNRRIVTDHTGVEYFSVEGGGTIQLFPSSDGEHLVYSKPYAEPGRILVDILNPSGERRPVDVGDFLAEDGSRLIDAVSEESNRTPGQVIWAADEKLLYTWWVADTAGVARDHLSALALLDTKNNTVVWQRIHPPVSYQPAVASGKPGDRYILLDHPANEEGISHTVIAGGSGETVGRAAGGHMWTLVGSEDGSFYANVTGRLKIGERFRRFLVKCSPQLGIVRHGMLYDGYSLNEVRELNGYVWGNHRACVLGEHCYPVVTAIYDMRGDPPSDRGSLPARVKPVLIEGYWFIVEMSDDQIVIVGQIDPRGGTLQKLAIDRAWIDRARR
jgi:hypothetical protein